MKQIDNFENVKANEGGFDRPAPGAYIGVILDAEDVPKKEYIKMNLDITEGDYKGYSFETLERAGFCPLHSIRSYKETAIGFFKAFINAVENSNEGYKWEWDEESLINKKIGFVIGEEEYEKNNGSIGERLYIDRLLSVDDVRAGKFKVPAKKLLEKKEAVVVESSDVEDNEDLPWV